ncbi:K(+)-transporting ATPase subunit F [Escherichia coli]
MYLKSNQITGVLLVFLLLGYLVYALINAEAF